MYREVTFSKPTERIGGAHAFDVDLFRLAELTAVLALCHRASLFLYFEEGTIGVFARGGAVSLDTGLTGYDEIRCANRMEPFVNSPCVLLVRYEDLPPMTVSNMIGPQRHRDSAYHDVQWMSQVIKEGYV